MKGSKKYQIERMSGHGEWLHLLLFPSKSHFNSLDAESTTSAERPTGKLPTKRTCAMSNPPGRGPLCQGGDSTLSGHEQASSPFILFPVQTEDPLWAPS